MHVKVPSTCAPLGSLDSLKSDVLLQVLNFPRPWLCHLQPGFCGWSTCWRRLRIIVLEYLSLFHVPSSQFPVSFWRWPAFALVFLLSLVYLQKIFLWPLTTLARFISAAAMAFLTWLLDVQKITLYSSQATCPCFHPLQASFLCLNLSSSTLFLHADLLPFLHDLHFIGMHHSWAWRRWSLTINQLSWAPISSRALSLRRPKSALLKSRAVSSLCTPLAGLRILKMCVYNLSIIYWLFCLSMIIHLLVLNILIIVRVLQQHKRISS